MQGTILLRHVRLLLLEMLKSCWKHFKTNSVILYLSVGFLSGKKTEK